jgi:hypothetical protein
MKQGRTIQELAAEIARQRDARKDYMAPTAQMEMKGYNDGTKLVLRGAAGGSFDVNPLAHGQLAEYTGVPKAYYDRMLVEEPDLLAANVNRWLGKANEKRMIRTMDGKVRAVLSDRYRPLENADLAEAVLPVISDMGLVMLSCEITERRLYMKCFDKRIVAEIERQGTDPAHTFIRKGDAVYAALTFSNSEVGFGALSVAAGLFDDGCTNFAAFSDSRMRKYHIGGKVNGGDDVYALLSDSTKRLTDAAIWAQTRDVVRSAFDPARFGELVKRVQETAEQKIEGDVVKVVEVFGEKVGLVQEERKSVLKHLIEGGTLSRYGMFRAVTRAAEDAVSYERASELERAGGRVIELAANDWQVIAKAA